MWQTIDSAPDETEVIVFDPANDPPVFTAERCFGEWQCSCENRFVPKDDFYGDPPKRPTHWQPLPTPQDCPE